MTSSLASTLESVSANFSSSLCVQENKQELVDPLVPENEHQSIVQTSSSSRLEARGLETAHSAQGVSDSSSLFAGTTVAQVPDLIQSRLTEAERQNNIAKQILKQIDSQRKMSVMACLDAVDFYGCTESSGYLLQQNMALYATIRSCSLVLNNEIEPFHLLLARGEGEADDRSIIPLIVPSGVRNQIITKEGTKMYLSPVREPSPEENRKVRRLIREALELAYGSEATNEICSQLEDPTNIDKPIKVEEVSNIMLLLADKERKDFSNDGTIPLISGAVTTVFRGSSCAEKNREMEFQKSQELFDQAADEISNPDKYLAETLYHSADALARGTGVAAAGVSAVGVTAAFTALITHFMTPGLLHSLIDANAATSQVSLAPASFGAHSAVVDYTSTNVFGVSSGFWGLMTINTLAGDRYMDHLFSDDNPQNREIKKIVAILLILCTPISTAYVAADVAVRIAVRFLSPQASFQKAQEAFSRLSGANVVKTLALLKEAQEIDRNLIDTLAVTLYLLPEKNAKKISFSPSASSDQSVLTTEATTPETMTPLEVQKALTQYIENRIVEREKLITSLQEKIAEANKPNPVTTQISQRRSSHMSRGPL